MKLHSVAAMWCHDRQQPAWWDEGRGTWARQDWHRHTARGRNRNNTTTMLTQEKREQGKHPTHGTGQGP